MEVKDEVVPRDVAKLLHEVVVSAILGLVVYCALKFYSSVIRKDSRIESIVNKFPGPPIKPIVGNGHQFAIPNHQIVDLVREWTDTYGKAYRVWLGNQAYVFISGATEAEKVLSSNEHVDKSGDYEILHNWLQQGLLTANRQKWHARRKLLTPSFHFQILDEFLEVFNEQSNVLVKILDENCLEKRFDIFPYVTRCALDIIGETTMGKKINAQRETNSPYVEAVYGISEALLQRLFRPWLRLNLIWKLSPQGRMEKRCLKIMHAFTEQVIAERRLYRKMKAEESKRNATKLEPDDDASFTRKRRTAFLDTLLDVTVDGKPLTDSDIRQETDTFMFEGHDTTAASLGWTIFLLAAHPEHQNLVHMELEEIFGDDKTGPITTAHVAQMKYLECCIKESLRMYPSVPFVARALQSDLLLDDNKLAPKGAVAFISTVTIHRDPSVYPNPNVFDPTRFTQENSIGRSPYAFVPFSAGPRNCIGQKFAMMEEKVVLSNFFRNYSVTAVENMSDVKVVPDLILRPKDGLFISLTKL